MPAPSYVTVTVREDIYRLLKRMAEIESRSVSNMVTVSTVYYAKKKHRELVEKGSPLLKELENVKGITAV